MKFSKTLIRFMVSIQQANTCSYILIYMQHIMPSSIIVCLVVSLSTVVAT